MATASGNKSGSFNGTYPQYATPYIFWSYDQSIPNNNTVLTATLKVKREKTGSTTNKASTPWSITIGGTKKSGTTSFKISSVSAGEYITKGSASKTISHNSDGSCSAVSISATIDISGTTLGTGSVSTSVTTSTIPRASQPTISASSVTMGSSVTIYTNRVSSSFTHSIYFSFGGISWRTISSGVGTSISWTPPVDLASQIPNGVSGTCTIHCETYNNGTYIGAKTTTLTLTVPSSVAPSISSISVSAGNSVVPASWGMYLQGKSQLKVVTNASGSYGSSITSYKVTGIDNNTYWSSNFTSGVLQISGTRTITVTVTDSRGRTATKTTTYTCVAYSNPSITTATVVRCNSDGTENEEGEYVKYSFSASVSAVSNKNTYSYKLGYKKNTDSSYTYITISNSAYTLSKSNVVISGVTFSVDNSYDFQFYVGDYFTSSSMVKSIGTGFTLMDFRSTGKGMAIGKVSEKDALEINMDMYDKNGGLIISDRLTKSITITGDVNTYYPVRISVSTDKEKPQTVSIWKNLGSQTANYSGNHSNGTSSLWLIYECRNQMWDGNGGYIKTKYKYQGYATLVSHVEMAGNAVGDLVVWLRGGGTSYNISCDNIFDVNIYYSNINLGSSQYPVNVAPRTDIGNGGIYSNTYLGYGNINGSATYASGSSGNFNVGGSLNATWDVKANGGFLFSTANGNTVQIGSQNSSCCHIYNSADIPFYFNRDIWVNGYRCLTSLDLTGGVSSLKLGDLYVSGANVAAVGSGASSIYFGSGGEHSGITTNLRGNNVRLYAHSGGAVYLGYSGSTAVTSDENLKNIYEIDDKYIDFFNNLKPITYIYKNNGHRNHMGFGARQVEESLIKAGLSTEEFAGVLKDEDITISADEMGSDEDVHFDELYSLRYEEFIALNTYMIQKQAKQIEEQNNLIADLKAKIEILEKQADIC